MRTLEISPRLMSSFAPCSPQLSAEKGGRKSRRVLCSFSDCNVFVDDSPFPVPIVVTVTSLSLLLASDGDGVSERERSMGLGLDTVKGSISEKKEPDNPMQWHKVTEYLLKGGRKADGQTGFRSTDKSGKESIDNWRRDGSTNCKHKTAQGTAANN